MADVCEAFCFFRVFCGLKFSYYYRSFSCFLTTIFSMRFSVARSAFTTAAAAGAVCIILNQRLVSSLNPQDVVGPAARLFSVFSVFCGLKFRALSCLSWLLKTFGCGQRSLQVFSCLFVVPYQTFGCNLADPSPLMVLIQRIIMSEKSSSVIPHSLQNCTMTS